MRVLIFVVVGALIGGGVAFMMATADDGEGSLFIASDQPVTEAQLLQKLRSEGWVNIQLTQLGHYFEVTGSRDSRSKKIMVDSLTGRLIDDDDD